MPIQGELRSPQEALRDVRRLHSATKNGTPGLTTWGSVFLRFVSLALHLSALLSSGVVLLEARCACGVPCARTPPVLRFSNQHRRLSHRLSVCRACYRSPAHPQPSFNRHTNHLSIAFQPPPTRSSPAPPLPIPARTPQNRYSTTTQRREMGASVRSESFTVAVLLSGQVCDKTRLLPTA